MLTSSDGDLVRAVNSQSLARWATDVLDDTSRGEDDRALAAAAIATCTRIGQQVRDETNDLLATLGAQGHDVVATHVETQQRHVANLTVDSVEAADAVADAMTELGFVRWEDWTGGAAISFRRVGHELTLARTREHTFVVRVRWREPLTRGRVARIVTPTTGDWSMIDLPRPLWWAYSLVRPVRLVAERIGRRDPHEAGLGPFLSTPEPLVAPLLELVGLEKSDVLVDIGCGDGRLSIEAATSTGCRSRGVELDGALVHAARLAADSSDVSNLVTIEHGDARSIDVSDVTVAFMFLPMDVIAALVPETLHALPRGARLIVHEQTSLPSSMAPRPNESSAIITEDAVTVAHTWVAD